MSETLTAVIGGQRYTGWTEFEVSGGLDRCVSDFDLAVTERWPDSPRPILPFTPVQLYLGSDLVLTGAVDSYRPSLSYAAHRVGLAGRSKTCDLVDCTPNVPAGQFSGYSVAAIARAICKIFGIGCVIETDLANVVVPDATIQPCEEAFEFLDRLCTVAGVIPTDDFNGNLVLTTAGSEKSGTALVQGVNILEVSADINGADRFSQYIVKGQAGLSANLGASGQTTPEGAQVQTDQSATETDAGVPRYRPKVFMAESATGAAPLQVQAQWHMNYALGRATKADVTVKGWRQNDGTLWRKNLMVTVTAPFIGVDEDLLIYGVAFSMSADDGRLTHLDLRPVQAAQPNPRLLRQKKGKKGRGGSGINWDGAGGI